VLTLLLLLLMVIVDWTESTIWTAELSVPLLLCCWPRGGGCIFQCGLLYKGDHNERCSRRSHSSSRSVKSGNMEL
jgi:hypothetical protein